MYNHQNDSNNSFADLGLLPELCQRIASFQWHQPTHIQQLAIPPALAGKDIIGTAETGSGKTGAFLLPLVQHWIQSGRPTCFALIMVPTRELALQLTQDVERLGEQDGIRVVRLVGGEDMVEQALALAWRRHHLIVATPGRLVDHLNQSPAFAQQQLSSIKQLVLDEADQMLGMAFADDLDHVLQLFTKPQSRNRSRGKQKSRLLDQLQTAQSAKDSRSKDVAVTKTCFPHPQTYLFSATMTQDVVQLRRSAVSHDALRCTTGLGMTTTKAETASVHSVSFPPHLAHYVLPLRLSDKPAALDRVLTGLMSSKDLPDNFKPSGRQAIVFCNRRQEARLVGRFLALLEHRSTSLTGQMSQPERKEALEEFASHQLDVLVATDVASRGLDLPSVDLVVNYSVPNSDKSYRHRVGRTARANRPGLALTLVTPDLGEAFIDLESRLLPFLSSKTTSMPRWPAAVVSARRLQSRLDKAWSTAAKELRREQELLQAAKRKLQNKADDEDYDLDDDGVGLDDVSVDQPCLPSKDADYQSFSSTSSSDSNSDDEDRQKTICLSGQAGIQAARRQAKFETRQRKRRRQERSRVVDRVRDVHSTPGWGRLVDSAALNEDDDGDTKEHLRYDQRVKAKYDNQNKR